MPRLIEQQQQIVSLTTVLGWEEEGRWTEVRGQE